MPSTAPHRLARFGVLTGLERPGDAVSFFGPNWFASVMGTGIIAVAAASLAPHLAVLRSVALAFWLLAGALLVVVTLATAAHWLRHPAVARSHFRHPTMTHFYGAPPMALLTVGTGTLLIGHDVVGLDLAIRIDAVLWTAGTALGLAGAIAVPLAFHRGPGYQPGAAFGGWLMPVVPPMVSAAAGALLVPHAPAGALRVGLLVLCYLLFAGALTAAVLVIPLIVRRHRTGAVGPRPLVPTLWIVVGPLGQSVTAVNLLATHAGSAVGPGVMPALGWFGVGFGVPVLAAAGVWGAVALHSTIRAARDGLPFSLAWWSFTFPIGTCVTGANALAVHTGSAALLDVAFALFAVLLVAWVVVATRTTYAALVRGTLLLPPAPLTARPA